MADFRTLIQSGIQLVADQQDARSNFSSPKMSVRKALGAVRFAARKFGFEKSESVSPPSSKRQKKDGLSEED